MERSVRRRAEERPEGELLLLQPPEDELLVRRAQAGDGSAERMIFERYAPHVARVLARLLGDRGELGDLLHDAFIVAFRSLRKLRDPRALRPWLTGVAVNIARGEARRRRRRRWLSFLAPEDLPDVPLSPQDEGSSAAARAVYQVLEALPVEEQLAFSLRFIAELRLPECAEALGVSLATAKRRIGRAEAAFFARAKERPELASYLAEREAP